MRRLLTGFGILLLVMLVLGAAGLAWVKTTGLSARGEPGSFETAVARRLRALSVPADARALGNPVPRTQETVQEGLAHWADHCAVCHAPDGSGNTAIGRNLWPQAPDMRAPATQDLTDGELFYIIENGIRFTGMPAWGTGDRAGETSSWRLVHFIRRLPDITPAELARIQELTPRSPADVRREIEEELFLQGAGEGPPPSPAPERHRHPGGVR